MALRPLSVSVDWSAARRAVGAQTDLFGKLRTPFGTIWRYHRIAGVETPFLPILIGGQVERGGDMSFQHLQPFPIFQADDVIREDGFADRYRRLSPFDGSGRRLTNMRQGIVNGADDGRQSTRSQLIVGGMCGDNLGSQPKDSGFSWLLNHFADLSCGYAALYMKSPCCFATATGQIE